MATFPADPNLGTITDTTVMDTAKFNEFVDNINAIGLALGDLINNTADGNIDLATGKVIKWSGVNEIYLSGGNLVLDHAVQVTGALDVVGALSIGSFSGNLNVTGNIDSTGILSVDTIDDSGAAQITVNENIVIVSGKDLTCQEVHANELRARTGSSILVHDSLVFGGGKTITIGIPPTYTVTNAVVDRSFDANSVAIAELADVVGTIINDLTAIGLFQ